MVVWSLWILCVGAVVGAAPFSGLDDPCPDCQYLPHLMIGCGYDLVSGNPDAQGVDPGYTQQIINPTYNDQRPTLSHRWWQPDGVQIDEISFCSGVTTSSSIAGGKSFQKSLNASVTAKVGVDFVLGSASFTASADFQSISSSASSDKTKFMETKAFCETYRASMLDSHPFNFTPEFQLAVAGLPGTALQLLSTFGTHYADSVTMGGFMMYRLTFNSSSWESMNSSGIDVSADASISYKVYTGQIDASCAEAKRVQEEFTSLSSSQQETDSGGCKFSGGDLAAWEKCVGDDPAPVALKIAPIYTLLTPFFFPNDKNITAKMTALKEITETWCAQVPGCTTDPTDPGFKKFCAEGDDQAQCAALVALASATNYTGWANKTGWLTGSSYCSWSGISCSNANVASLSLSYNQLTGTIPDSLSQLASLTDLDLSGNHLTGTIPDWLSQLTNLTRLSLTFNPLTGTIPDSLSQLASLTELDLGADQLTGTIPDSLSQLTNLTRLDLSGNQLTGTIPDWLSQLRNLQYLDLSGNQLSTIPDSLSQLTNLQYLDLSHNQLTGTIPDSLSQLTNLTVLNLGSNQLTGTIPDSLSQLTIMDLDLWGNQLTGTIPDSLSQLTNLTRLFLAHNQLAGTIPESLSQLTNLMDLYLGSNQLTGTIPDWLSQLTNLDELDLGSNKLTGTIPESLSQLTNLTWLHLGANLLTGVISESVCDLPNLDECDFSNNTFSCPVPPTCASNCKAACTQKN